MIKNQKWIGCLFSLFFLAVSAHANPPEVSAPVPTFPSTVTVNKKQSTLTIRFKSNRTTGYSWFLSKYNSHLLQPLSYHYQAPAVGMMGAPGVSVWTFQVLPAAKRVPSMTTITWIHARPWEKSGDAEAHSVTVYFTLG